MPWWGTVLIAVGTLGVGLVAGVLWFLWPWYKNNPFG